MKCDSEIKIKCCEKRNCGEARLTYYGDLMTVCIRNISDLQTNSDIFTVCEKYLH